MKLFFTLALVIILSYTNAQVIRYDHLSIPLTKDMQIEPGTIYPFGDTLFYTNRKQVGVARRGFGIGRFGRFDHVALANTVNDERFKNHMELSKFFQVDDRYYCHGIYDKGSRYVLIEIDVDGNQTIYSDSSRCYTYTTQFEFNHAIQGDTILLHVTGSDPFNDYDIKGFNLKTRSFFHIDFDSFSSKFGMTISNIESVDNRILLEGIDENKMVVYDMHQDSVMAHYRTIGSSLIGSYYARNDSVFFSTPRIIGDYANHLMYYNDDGSVHNLSRAMGSPNVQGFRTPHNTKDARITHSAIDSIENQYLFFKPKGSFASVAKILPNGMQDLNFQGSIVTSNELTGMVICQNKLFVVGNLKGGGNHTVDILDLNYGKSITRLITNTLPTNSVVADENYVYLGGSFSYNTGGKTLKNVLRIDAKSNKIDTSWLWTHVEKGENLSIVDSLLVTGGVGTQAPGAFNKQTLARIPLNFPTSLRFKLCYQVGVDSFILTSNDVLYIHYRNGVNYVTDTLFHSSQREIETSYASDQYIYIATHDSSTIVTRFDLKEWKWDKMKIGAMGHAAFMFEAKNYFFVGGTLTYNNNVNPNQIYTSTANYRDHSFIDLKKQELGFLHFKTTRPDIKGGSHRNHYVLDDSVIIQFPVYWGDPSKYHDSTYVRLTNLKTQTIDYHLVEPNRSHTAVNPYAISNFSYNQDTLFCLYIGNYSGGDSVTMIRASTGEKLGSYTLSCAPCGQFIYKDEKISLLSGVQEDVKGSLEPKYYQKGLAGTSLKDNQPVHYSWYGGRDNLDWVFADSLVFSSELVSYNPHVAVLVMLNLKTGDTTQLVKYDPPPTHNIGVYGDYVYYNATNGTFNISRVNWKKRSNPQVYLASGNFEIVDHCLYYVDKGGLIRKNLITSSENRFEGFSANAPLGDLYWFHYKDKLIYTTTGINRAENRIYVYDTAAGFRLFARTLPNIVTNRAFGRESNLQLVGDYLIFKTNNDTAGVLPSRNLGYHIMTGLIDTTLFDGSSTQDYIHHIMKNDTGYISYATDMKCAKPLGQPCSSNGILDIISCDEVDVVKQPIGPFQSDIKPSYISHNPNKIGQAKIEFSIQTSGMPDDAVFFVERQGDTLYPLTSSQKNLGGAILSGTLDASQAKRGAYDLHIFTTTDSFLIKDALHIDSALNANISISCIIRDSLRIYKAYPGKIVVSNTGNTDAYLVPVALHYTGMNADFMHDVLKMTSVESGWNNNYTGVELGWQSRYGLIPFIGANQSIELYLDITGASPEGEIKIELATPFVNPPFLDFDSSGLRSLSNFMNCGNFGLPELRDSCSEHLFGHALESKLRSHVYNQEYNKIKFLDNPQRGTDQSIVNLIDLQSSIYDYLTCTNNSGLNISKSRDIMEDLIQKHFGLSNGNNCAFEDTVSGYKYAIAASYNHSIAFLNSIDPNYKVGPLGVQGTKYVNRYPKEFNFDIHFENDASATGSAQTITIIDTLDVDVFNVSELEFSSIKLGQKRYWLTGDRSALKHNFPLGNEHDVRLNATSSIDKSTGVLRIVLEGVHLVTNKQIDLPAEAGILSPNNIDGDGEGTVSFSVKLVDGKTPVNVKNSATIVFDQNEAIRTNTWAMCLDTVGPKSKVSTIANNGTSTTQLSWSGTDDGVGIAYYDIYISSNGGAFRTWKTNTSDTSGTFLFHCDTTYAFYSVAYDLLGNVETKNSPDQVFVPTCGALENLHAETVITGPTGYKDRHYIANETFHLPYQLKTVIKYDSTASYYVKQLRNEIEVTPALPNFAFKVNSIQINDAKFNVNLTLSSSGRVVKVLRDGERRIEFTGKVENGYPVFYLKSLNASGEESFENDEGIALVDLNNDLTITFDLSRTKLGVTEHNDVFKANVYSLVDANYATKPALWENVVDKLPPVSSIDAKTSTNKSFVNVFWTSVDDHCGVESFNLSIYEGESLRGEHILSSTRDSFTVFIPDGVIYKAVLLGTDSLGNVEESNPDNTIINLTASSPNDVMVSGLTVYPNPTSDVINIQSHHLLTDLRIEIYDSKGSLALKREIGTTNGERVKLKVPSGLYFLKAVSSEGAWQLPIIVN